MSSRFEGSFVRYLMAAALVVPIPSMIAGADANLFDKCKADVLRVINENHTLNTSAGLITRDNISKYIYNGPVKNLNADFPRDQFLTLTYEGCKVLCNDPVDWYWTKNGQPTLTLSITANWVLPIIALIASLPYDSLHQRGSNEPWHNGRVGKTICTLVNWMGSPQTALTATLWNIYQIRMCKSHTFFKSGSNERSSQAMKNDKLDAYYVLSCINQFELPEGEARTRFLELLVYGLMRPLNQRRVDARRRQTERPLTSDLLAALVFQLRMFRRRGVYPAGLNIIVFLGAFGISVGLAFGELGEFTTAHSLALGLLFSWLPMLLLLSILDRNPVSATRNKVLIQRWLWNVAAVSDWAAPPAAQAQGQPDREAAAAPAAAQEEVLPALPAAGAGPALADGTAPILDAGQAPPEVAGAETAETADLVDSIDWWTPEKQASAVFKVAERAEAPTPAAGAGDSSELTSLTGTDDQDNATNKLVSLGEFIGQGRKMGYCGLVYHVLTSLYDDNQYLRAHTAVASSVARALERYPRPRAWWLMALVSLLLVWCEILMAFLVSYATPIVALSCRSGLYLAYGGLGTVTWVVNCAVKQPGRWTKGFCYFINSLACAVLLFTVFAQMGGVLNNCVCKCGVAGYMGFESSDFYRLNFDLLRWWVIASVLGGLPVVGCLAFSWILLSQLKDLWRASEGAEPERRTHWHEVNQQQPGGRADNILRADMLWLI